MKGLLSIGELSKLQNISRQTLIYYDHIGLFSPAYIDENTHYRYYSIKQIDSLDTILIMKKIGFSLEEIKQYMKDYRMDQSIDMLEKQIPLLTQQIKDLQMIKSRIEHRCALLKQVSALKNKKATIQIENMSCQTLFIEPVSSPYTLEETSVATKKCFVHAFQQKIPIYFQSGDIIPFQHIQQGNYTLATHAFLACEPSQSQKNIIQIPEGKIISSYHIGDYASIGKTYKELLSYCETHQIQIQSDAYEFALHDYLSTSDENEYITKIIFYIQ